MILACGNAVWGRDAEACRLEVQIGVTSRIWSASPWLSKAHGVCLRDRSDEPASKHFLHILVCIKVLKSNQQINIQSSESRFSQLQHKHLTK